MDEQWVKDTVTLLLETRYHDDLIWYALNNNPSFVDMYGFLITLTQKAP